MTHKIDLSFFPMALEREHAWKVYATLPHTGLTTGNMVTYYSFGDTARLQGGFDGSIPGSCNLFSVIIYIYFSSYKSDCSGRTSGTKEWNAETTHHNNFLALL
jgi:hypothetical protein